MVVIACIAALASGYFYFFAAQNKNEIFKQTGRKLYYLQAFSVVAIFVILFSIIFLHRYEYFYAWRHSNNALPVYYMISCFWEGQEGSFLLWMFWNAVIGVILTRTAKSWESPVMAVVCLAQFALATMILGINLGGTHIGSSPFDLFREARGATLATIPTVQGQANYLMALKDGNGLNPLLQNYWMVIHPPTLFLGFALAVVPFAYSIAGIWQKREREWLAPALQWSLVCVGVLGTGIIMGGFWAYESLSFGGYWAWDPVENASLMPWIIMASAAHMILISRNTGRHLFTTHLLVQLTFWLVLYATFLTRSGILGDASVHSFTDLGLSGQLLLFLFVFILISVAVLVNSLNARLGLFSGFVLLVLIYVGLKTSLTAKDYSYAENILKYLSIGLFFVFVSTFFYLLYKRTKTEMPDEKWSSRELWMFLGSMFLILSLVQVFSATSIPVFNKLFGFTTAVPKAEAYNKSQVWLAMPIMILMAIGQWFRYRESDKKTLFRSLLINAAITVVVGSLLAYAFAINEAKYILFLLLGVFIVVSNIMYLRTQKKLEWLGYGASIAHAGFGILLIGALVSSVNQKIISSSFSGINLAPEVDDKGRPDAKAMDFNRQNRILYRHRQEPMANYLVTYRNFEQGKGKDSIDKYFNVLFEELDKNGNVKDSFVVHPKTQNNPNMGLLAEPSTKHYISKDVFTHVNYESSLEKPEPFSSFKEQTVHFGEVFLTESGKTKLVIDSMQKMETGSGIIIRLLLTATRLKDKVVLYADYLVNLGENRLEGIPATNDDMGLYVNISRVNIPEKEKPGSQISFNIVTGERTPMRPYIVIKAIEFPWINLVWSGTIIMVLGVAMAISYKAKQQKAMLA